MDATGLKITWSDGRIEAGQVQRPLIENRLQKAQVVLLLLSVDYLESTKKGNLKIEMTWAVQRDRRGDVRVIPILVSSCAWKHTSFGRLAVLPSSEIPIDLANNLNQILHEVAVGVKTATEEWVEEHQENCPT
jgi:hypothetical protein